MKQKQPLYKGLDIAPVFYTDTSELSPELFVITEFPTKLTAGKNILKLRGNSKNLKLDALLHVEILDYNNQPIYYESTTYIGEDRSRVIAIYIYPDTPPGEARITLTTEAQQINGELIPDEWKHINNVKWIRTTLVNPTLSNSAEIIFETLPTVEIEEQVGVQLNRVYNTIQTPIYNSGSVIYRNLNNTPILILTNGTFIRDMVGGTVTITSPSNPTPKPYYNYTLPPYSATIKKVLSDNTLLLDTPYLIASSQSFIPHQFDQFDNSPYSIEYTATPTYSSTQNSESFALVKINNLEPVTGDISRIKVFINNTGTIGTWEQVSDIELKETEIFVTSTASLTPDKSIGFIDSQNTINTYYEYLIYEGNQLIGSSSLTYNTSILNNSVYAHGKSVLNPEFVLFWVELVEIWGENEPQWWGFTGLPWPPPPIYLTEFLYPNMTMGILKIKDSYKGTFFKNAKYKVTLDAFGVESNSKISVYLSGSAINTDPVDQFNKELPITIGKKIGELDVTKLGNRIDDYVLPFTTDNNGTAVLIFVIERGNWYLSDIRTTSDNDPGYTPNYTRIRTLIPTAHKSQVQLNFKVEYYNVAGNKCNQINYVNNVPWIGGNRYIDGEYSMLTGSLYVADSLNSGIGISGYSNTGFIRSLGYSGFDAGYPGFLLYSGSALGGALSKGVAYSGVGLELYASPSNYFRYSTRDSQLDIRTEQIYLGSSTTFISASNGKLQISSSKFSVDAQGNVTASDAEFRGQSTADFYQWRNVTDTTTTGFQRFSNFVYSSKNYVSLNLTGSYDPGLGGAGPSVFSRLNGTPSNKPLAAIKIHPDSWNSSKYQFYGGMVVLEAGYPFVLRISPYDLEGSALGDASGLQDARIGADSNDWYYNSLSNYTLDGVTYNYCLGVPSGARVLLFQGQNDWRVFSSTKAFASPASLGLGSSGEFEEPGDPFTPYPPPVFE